MSPTSTVTWTKSRADQSPWQFPVPWRRHHHLSCRRSRSSSLGRIQEQQGNRSSQVATMLGSLGASLWKQRPDSVDSRASIQATNVDRECVVSTVFSSQFKGRKIEIKTSCIRWLTENLQTVLDPKVDSAVRGERMAQPKLYEADAEVEAGNWHRFSWDQSRIWISTISATWADQSQRDKISLYGELELRSRLFQDNHARDCKEIEELRRIDCEETDRARQASIDELSVHQERNPTTVSQFLTQIQDLQNKVNSLTDAREFYNPESGISSGATHVPDQTSTILSPRTLPRCDSGMPRDTQCGTGITGNVFERPRAEEGLSSIICKNSENLASSSQGLRPDTTGIARKRDDEMKREPLSVEVVCWIILVELHLTMVWWIIRDFRFRNCILEKFMTLWKFKARKSINFKTEVCSKSISSSHSALDQRSWDCKINWWTLNIAIDCGARYPRFRYAWCDDCVCIERASQHADTFPKESVEEQRA